MTAIESLSDDSGATSRTELEIGHCQFSYKHSGGGMVLLIIGTEGNSEFKPMTCFIVSEE